MSNLLPELKACMKSVELVSVVGLKCKEQLPLFMTTTINIHCKYSVMYILSCFQQLQYSFGRLNVDIIHFVHCTIAALSECWF